MPAKPKIGFYWCASCGGCEESLVDIAEAILDVADLVDFAIWPVAMDFKRADVEAIEDGAIFATMINGSVRTSEQEEMAKLLRKKSQVIIAYGSCAQSGGIPSLGNQFSREQIMRYVYHDAPTVNNQAGTEPQPSFCEDGRVATLPEFRNVVRSLDQVVDVDYYIPGCAPNPELVLAAIKTLLGSTPSSCGDDRAPEEEGVGDGGHSLPPKGSVLAPDVALCSGCPRLDSKPAMLGIAEFKRTHLHPVDPDVCLLAQGFLCMGPATRSGCGERCIRGNMPCTGCFGPLSNVRDHGAKILSSLASIVAGSEEKEIDAILDGVVDPVGTFYRYGLAKSMLRRKVDLPVGGRN